jgi:type VI secretion system Hcp family effector
MNASTFRKPGGALLPLATAALLALAGTLSAAPRFVMEIRDYEGNFSIPGESNAAGREDSIDVVAFGKAYTSDHGFPSVDTTALECSIAVDKALPKLLEALCEGATIPKVDIFILDDAPSEHEAAHMSLEHVQVVGINPVIRTTQTTESVWDDTDIVHVSLTFSKVTWSYTTYEGGVADETSSTHVAYESTEDPAFDDDGDGIPNDLDPDDDNDGIPDEHENAQGTNALTDDADEDLDKDKQSNGDEFLAGTLANDPSSFFAISSLSVETGPEGKTATVSFPVIADRHYRLLGTPNPALPRESWIEFDAFDTPPGSPDTHADVILNPAILPQLGRILFTVEVNHTSP